MDAVLPRGEAPSIRGICPTASGSGVSIRDFRPAAGVSSLTVAEAALDKKLRELQGDPRRIDHRRPESPTRFFGHSEKGHAHAARDEHVGAVPGKGVFPLLDERRDGSLPGSRQLVHRHFHAADGGESTLEAVRLKVGTTLSSTVTMRVRSPRAIEARNDASQGPMAGIDVSSRAPSRPGSEKQPTMDGVEARLLRPLDGLKQRRYGLIHPRLPTQWSPGPRGSPIQGTSVPDAAAAWRYWRRRSSSAEPSRSLMRPGMR